MAVLHKDFCSGTLPSPLSAGDIDLTSPGFAALPAVAGNDHLWVTLDPTGTTGPPELVRVVAHQAGSSLATVARGQGGTTARTHVAGVYWAHGLPVAEWDGLAADTAARLPLAGGTVTGDLTVPALTLGVAPTLSGHVATKQYVEAGDVWRVRWWRGDGPQIPAGTNGTTYVLTSSTVPLEAGAKYRMDVSFLLQNNWSNGTFNTGGVSVTPALGLSGAITFHVGYIGNSHWNHQCVGSTVWTQPTTSSPQLTMTAYSNTAAIWQAFDLLMLVRRVG